MNIQDIFKKLNFSEMNILNKYIENKISTAIFKNAGEMHKAADEIEQYHKDRVEKTWDVVSTYLHISMRKNKISEERIKKITSEMNEGIAKHKSEIFLDIENINKSEVIQVMTKNEYLNLLELAMEGCCRDCKHNNHRCKAYELFKKYKAEKPSGYKLKCKYAYTKG